MSPEVPSRVNWRPEDARAALSIMEAGGPLVDPATGEVILMATTSDYVWTQLVGLPADADPAPRPIDAEAPRKRLTTISSVARAAWLASELVAA